MASLTPPTTVNTVQKTEPNRRLVDREEFCKLLLGYRRMIRADEPSTGMRGLRDLQTGVTYLIEREKLSSLQSLRMAH